MLVLMIMIQLVFSGGLVPLAGRAGLEQVSYVVPARWGFAMTAATVDLRAIETIRAPAVLRAARRRRRRRDSCRPTCEPA